MPRKTESFERGYDHGFEDGYKLGLEEMNKAINSYSTEMVPVYSVATGWQNAYRCRKCRAVNETLPKYCHACGRKVLNYEGT